MRLVFWILLSVTILSTSWALFLLTAYPFAAADFFYGDYRSQLDQAVGRDRANQLTGQVSRTVHSFVQGTAVLVGLPLLVTNAAWVFFTVRLLKDIRSNRIATEAEPANDA